MKFAPIAAFLALAAGAIQGAAQPPSNPPVSLHLAALEGNVGAVRQQIEAGAEVDARDQYGSTPLIIAATFGRVDVTRALLDAGADPNIRSSEGSTPLHIAAFLARTEIVTDLLAHGANKRLRDRFGNTARESVEPPFDEVRAVYDTIAQGLAPLGLALDYDRIRATRPRVASMLGTRPDELAEVSYPPLPGTDWAASTPEAEGLDPDLVAELYLDAAALSSVYGMLVVRHGRLIGERYYHGGSVGQKALLQSVTKSYTSALVGLALERGCLASVDQPMLSFFPELAGRITDPRKREITIRHLLQMRAGYPWEETNPQFWEALLYGDLVRLIVDFPLISDPGAEFHYSNVTSHLLGVIVARACHTDLKTFADEHLFSRIDVEVGEWIRDRDGYYVGLAEMHFTAREMARFGQLYLRRGRAGDTQVVSPSWVEESLQPYSSGITSAGVVAGEVGRYLRDVGYGYQWWSARAGAHRFDFAWGHGGQLVVLVPDHDLVVVVTSDPFYRRHDREAWQHEVANLNVVGKFIASLPDP